MVFLTACILPGIRLIGVYAMPSIGLSTKGSAKLNALRDHVLTFYLLQQYSLTPLASVAVQCQASMPKSPILFLDGIYLYE